MNLRTRVAVSGAATVIAALAVVAAIEYPAVDAGMRADVDAQLAGVVSDSSDDYNTIIAKQFSSGDKRPTFTMAFSGRLLDLLLPPIPGEFDKFAPVTARDVAVGEGTAAPYYEDVPHEGALYRVYVAPISLADYPNAAIRIAEPESDRTQTLHQLGWLLAVLIPAAGLLTAVGARALAARVLRPVARLTSAVEHVTATGDLATPIAVTGRDEVARLGRAFSAMTAALDGSVGAQRRLVADASHELRTPLTSMVTNLELLAERPEDPQAPRLIDEALRQARELTVLTNDLVDLARFGEAPGRDEVVYLDQVCAELAERRGARLRVGPGPFYVRGDPAALERAVANLVDNALKFGTEAVVSVWAAADPGPAGGGAFHAAGPAGPVIVEVCDDGPGIPAADLPYVFDRFHRSEAARALPGSGLGLAIVKQIVEAHHGRVEAVPRERGALLRITLPAVAAP
ncbi:MAG: ATP-binding protein [Catenulispora sp.]